MRAPNNDRTVNAHKLYAFAHQNHSLIGQLVDRGANGGLAGADMRILQKTNRKVNVTGIDDHELNDLDVVTCATLLATNYGVVVGVFHEYAYHGKGKSIHASAQLEHYRTVVDDRSWRVGGEQRLITLEGYAIPLVVSQGLVYIDTLGPP